MRFVLLLIVIFSGDVTALAEEANSQAVTVGSLLNREFNVVGAVQSQIGLGVLLQKKNELFVCFVSETRTSKNVTTHYCKAVE